ncbi:MAG: hydrogenase 4 subunit B [Methanomassiliicoccus sp.]|nr:hydrogenase 4 subunit B [Methanomassiliicoccus sp.]
MYGQVLFVLLVIISLGGALAALLLGRWERACRTVSFASAAVSAVLGALISLEVLAGGGTVVVTLPTAVAAFGHFSFTVDRLSAFFMLTVSVLSVCVAIYSVGYTREYEGRYGPGTMGFLFNVFLLSLFLVVTASNAILFLIMWETMALSSYLLVVYEHRNRESVSSGLTYVAMTHLGTALISVAFLIMWLHTPERSFDFDAFRELGAAGLLPGAARAAAFVLLLAGFGTKAGLVPLHVWLPQAHPAAPSNVSAMMSGVMVKTAVYMLIRCYFDFLGVTDSWWGLVILLVACVSALVGVLYALMEEDIKRALAYSTVENIGLIFIGLGAAMVFQSYYLADPVANAHLADLAALALIAVLFHTLAHSLFKGLLFMGAGAVMYATHTRDLEELGGLAKRMRWTSVLFFIGALSISAIPPFSGFVGEWLLFQSLLLTQNINDPMVNLLLPVAVAVLALTGALAAACFVRIFGSTFLARPRSKHAAEAVEVPRTMLAGMGIAAALCVLMGLLSVLIVPAIDSVTSSILGVSIGSKLVNGLVLSPPAGEFSSMSPLVIGALLLFIVPAAFLVVRRLGGRQAVARGDTWDCGTPLSSRAEYTAAGFSEPINRIFRSIYRPHVEVKTEYTSSRLIKRHISFSRSNEPLFERYLYGPAVALVVALARRVGVIQKGSIQAYLAYIFVILLALLVVLR